MYDVIVAWNLGLSGTNLNSRNFGLMSTS